MWGMRMVRAPPNTGAHERGGKEGVTAHKSAHSPSRGCAVVGIDVVLDLACASHSRKRRLNVPPKRLSRVSRRLEDVVCLTGADGVLCPAVVRGTRG